MVQCHPRNVFNIELFPNYGMHHIVDMDPNLAVGDINCMSLNFIPPTFSTCIKNSKLLYFNIEAYFLNSMITIM